jgi:hypothetical protein
MMSRIVDEDIPIERKSKVGFWTDRVQGTGVMHCGIPPIASFGGRLRANFGIKTRSVHQLLSKNLK